MTAKSNPDISVIVPVYHSGKRLLRCVRSILKTSEKIEVILVNDGSTDEDANILQSCARSDPRIRVLTQQHAGISAARNRGISASRGKYLAFVDADDEIRADMLSVLRALLRNGEQMAACGVWRKDGGGQMRDGVLTAEKMFAAFAEPDGWEYVIACNKLYDKKLFATVRFPEGRIHEDEFLIPLLILRAKKVVCTSYVGYIYNLHGNNVSRSLNMARLDYLKAMELQARLFEKMNLTVPCQKIVQKEFFAYLTLRAAHISRKSDDIRHIQQAHTAFRKAARWCGIRLGLKIKLLFGNTFPETYFAIDKFFRCRNDSEKPRPVKRGKRAET